MSSSAPLLIPKWVPRASWGLEVLPGPFLYRYIHRLRVLFDYVYLLVSSKICSLFFSPPRVEVGTLFLERATESVFWAYGAQSTVVLQSHHPHRWCVSARAWLCANKAVDPESHWAGFGLQAVVC